MAKTGQRAAKDQKNGGRLTEVAIRRELKGTRPGRLFAKLRPAAHLKPGDGVIRVGPPTCCTSLGLWVLGILLRWGQQHLIEQPPVAVVYIHLALHWGVWG